jgi:OmpA-OmpF porin, OOP family
MDREQATCFFIILFLFFFSPGDGCAQRVYSYDFSNGLVSDNDSAPPLRILGAEGSFVKELLPELGDTKRTVYQFEANSGLQFDNRAAYGFLNGSYTVEIYFRLKELDSWKRVLDFKNRKSDNGCYIYEGRLNFFNFATGEKAPVKPNEYIHYVFSRDIETHQIRMYVDGESKVEFVDPGDEATLGSDQVLNFFQDDLIAGNEASEGAVALIRLYDRVMTPVFVRQQFRQLARTINESPAPPKIPKTETPPVVTEVRETVQPVRSEALVEVSGKVYNGKNLGFLDGIDVVVRKESNDSIVARTKAVKGLYSVLVPPQETYRITAQSPGFQTRSIIVTPKKGGEVKTLLNMQEENYDKPIFVIPFAQSEYSLTEPAKIMLDSLLAFLNARPELTIRLLGHTDNVGEFEKNIQLSGIRTVIVQDYLLKKGIDTARIELKGYGPTRPVASNASEASRQQNRRVEVWVAPVPTKR